jgi:hypothetical protein
LSDGSGECGSSALDGCADALVGATATDVAGHGSVDVGIAGLFVLLQQGRGAHDLARLAIAALRDVLGDPCILHGLAHCICSDIFDCGNFLARCCGDGQHAAARGYAIDMYGAGATLGHAAPKLRAGEIEAVAQYPEQGCVVCRIGGELLAVDVEGDHREGLRKAKAGKPALSYNRRMMSRQTAEQDPLAIALAWREAGQRAAIATVVSTWGSAPRPAGSQLVCNEQGQFAGSVSGGCVEVAVIEAAAEVMRSGVSQRLEYGVSDEQAFDVGLACGGRIQVYVEALE